MLIESIAVGALVVVALVATVVGLRRRRADRLSADPAATLPNIDGRPVGTDGTYHGGAFGGSSDGGGGGFDGGGFDGGGGSHSGGGFDGGGGHQD